MSHGIRKKKYVPKCPELSSVNMCDNFLSLSLSLPILAFKFNESEIEQVNADVRGRIANHLFKFSGSAPTLSYDFSNQFVKDVCRNAKKYLEEYFHIMENFLAFGKNCFSW